MNISLHRNFEKKYVKLRVAEQKRFRESRDLFLRDPFDPVLNNHALSGKYLGYRSINVGGDLRVVYKFLDASSVLFAIIDKHSNLYG
jgi:addiction module RelE/StbE family toxin